MRAPDNRKQRDEKCALWASAAGGAKGQQGDDRERGRGRFAVTVFSCNMATDWSPLLAGADWLALNATVPPVESCALETGLGATLLSCYGVSDTKQHTDKQQTYDRTKSNDSNHRDARSL